METKPLHNGAMAPENCEILLSFASPKTQKHIVNKHKINKNGIRQFLKQGLIKCLTPMLREGRLYTLTLKARELLSLPTHNNEQPKDWETLGWILASPKQRLAVLNALSQNPNKQQAETIRFKCKKENPCISRHSIRTILRELENMGLIESELTPDRFRYFWITNKGKLIANDLLIILREKNP